MRADSDRDEEDSTKRGLEDHNEHHDSDGELHNLHLLTIYLEHQMPLSLETSLAWWWADEKKRGILRLRGLQCGCWTLLLAVPKWSEPSVHCTRWLQRAALGLAITNSSSIWLFIAILMPRGKSAMRRGRGASKNMQSFGAKNGYTPWLSRARSIPPKRNQRTNSHTSDLPMNPNKKKKKKKILSQLALSLTKLALFC